MVRGTEPGAAPVVQVLRRLHHARAGRLRRPRGGRRPRDGCRGPDAGEAEHAAPHPDGVRPTIVYDDYLNTLENDPTTARLLPLVSGAGTDRDPVSVGAALLDHDRAHLDWIEALLDRHPGLVRENCASGAMRADSALLSLMELQSTSDQQDPLLYPPIPAAAPLSILPERAASWACPEPGTTAEQTAFTLATGLSGRFYLCGHLDRLDAAQLELVAEAVETARELRDGLARSVPLWPLDLPAWEDRWVASARAVGRASS